MPGVVGVMAENRIWRCSECRSTFPKSKLLEAHSRHTKHKAYSCTKDALCRKAFRLRTALIRHEASHSEAKRHVCQRCNKAFHRRDHCQEHETICRTNRFNTRLPVSNAELNGATEEVRAASLLTEMSTSVARPQSKLQGQDFTLITRADTPQHPKIFCEFCNENPAGFLGEHELRRHWDRAHAQQRSDPDPTAVEGWRASEVRELDSALRTTGRSPRPHVSKHMAKNLAAFKCSFCPKRFTRAYNFRSHLRTHADERPYTCLVCGKAFARMHDRQRHESLHWVEKHFVCKGILKTGDQWGCGRRFAVADTLGRHFRSEAGKICIKPLLDEEFSEKRKQSSDEQIQNEGAAGHATRPLPAQDGVYGDWEFFMPLLEQYPAL